MPRMSVTRRLAACAGGALLVGVLFAGSAAGQSATPTSTTTPIGGGPTATPTGTAGATTATPTPTGPTATTTSSPTGTTTPGTATTTATPAATGTGTPTATAAAVVHDARYFSQTGFRVDDDVIWDYFNRRGGVTTFGFPVSRTFLFRGVRVQFFQRRLVEIGPNGQARQANLLDPELMPYTRINGATFPAADPAVQAAAPPPTDAPATIDFVRRNAPDQVNGRPTNFYQTFANTVPYQVAFPNGGDPNLLPGIDLEMWGVPTSNASADPNNTNFVFLRWQRGIMHYRAECNCTEAILLADYLKAILTGVNLPADLDAEAQGSPYYKQYDPAQPQWVRDRARLPNTDMTSAFVPG